MRVLFDHGIPSGIAGSLSGHEVTEAIERGWDSIRCRSYDEARDYSRVIYLHEWDGNPFYWGKAHNSFFGGHKRKRDGLEASGRYNAG